MITSQKANCQKLWNPIPKQYNIESIKLKKEERKIKLLNDEIEKKILN
jgi:hypothetical protein